MRKRVAFAPSGRMLSNRGLQRDERGVSPVIGAVLVLALVILAMSIYIGQVVPSYLRHNEAEHMNSVRGAFIDLQQLILSRTDGTIELSMSPEPTPIFSLAPTSSKVEVTRARWVKRYQPLEDTYVSEDSPGSTAGGSSETLWTQSYKSGATAYNRRIYTKFNLSDELSGISATRIEEAWLVLYAENITKFLGRPWDNPDNDPITNPDVDQSYLPDVPITVEIRGVSEMENWTEDTLTWDIAKNNFTIGDTIKAMDFPYEDNHTIKENDVWFTWDVTSWVRDRVSGGKENVGFLLKPAYENAALAGGRYATFSSKERVRGSLGWSWTVEVGDRDDGDNTYPEGYIPQYSNPHLTVIYENGDLPGPTVYDDWGAFIEGGRVRFDTDYREFPSHSFIFESGALLQQQYGYAYEFMISDPGLVVGERLDENRYGDNIAVYVNRYRIVNSDKLTTASDVKLMVTVKENTDYRIEPTDTNGDGILDPNRDNVLITVRTSFEWPWKYYFRDQTSTGKGFNIGDYEGGLSKYVETPWGDQKRGTADFMSKLYVDRNTRMYIFGLEWDPSVYDIYYYDRTYDVRVEIGV